MNCLIVRNIKHLPPTCGKWLSKMRKMVKLACTIKQAVRYYITDDKLGEVEKCDIIIILNARKKISRQLWKTIFYFFFPLKKFLQLKKFFLQIIMIEEDVNKVRPWTKSDNHSHICEVAKYMQVTHILLVGMQIIQSFSRVIWQYLTKLYIYASIFWSSNPNSKNLLQWKTPITWKYICTRHYL